MSVFKQGNEEIYQKISELTLTRLQPNPMFEDDLPRLDAYGIGLDDIPEQLEIENMQLSRLGLARAVFSSRSAALESIDNFLQEMDDKQFAHPDKTMSEIQEIKQLVLENFDDSKYQGLIRRLKEKKGEKILIFTGRIPSMMELVERIKEDIPGINVEAHVGTDKQKQIKRERFAPKAHHKKIRKNRQIDILISTDSLAEGVDLQDASVAIDYDLWWTPLTLQQRMGRLDRPTDEFREFEVWRFVNLIPEYNKIVRIDQYLSSRAMLLKRLIADGAYEQFEVRDWEKTDDLGIITVEIDELDDILGSDELKSTSYHIADLADAGDDIIAEALRLPTNFVTSIISEKNGTFALFKFGEIKHMAFVNHDSQEIIHSPGNSDSEKVMRNIRSDADTNLSELPTDHYERLEELVNQISEIFGYDADEIEMIFSASLRKE